jgi:hypothetical protein
MVKNYLVCAVRPIEDGWHIEKNQDLYNQYRQMYDLRLASFRKFVTEPFEDVLWTDPVKNNDEYTIANWNAIKELWHSEPCNIFWAGADTLMTQPTSLFSDRFKEYRLFNYTDPKSYRGYVNYFNDDIQYYSHAMRKETWDIGEQLWSVREGHPDQFWGFDQLRHNEMFWSQGISEDDWFHPELAYQAMRLRELSQEVVNLHNSWNGIDVRNAHILHFHASRGSQQVIDLMKLICQQLGVI